MKVKLGTEVYMTEYNAIRIVLTLQSLYTCTHSPQGQPVRRPTEYEAPVYCNETNSDGHHPAFPFWSASSRERSPETVKSSTVEFQ